MIRFCDVFFSLLGLIVLSPIFVIIALCIVLDSRGGVFYRQVRVGRGGKDFRLFKFRSGYNNTSCPRTGTPHGISPRQPVPPGSPSG